MTIEELVAESNKIEGIIRPPTIEEIDIFQWFLEGDQVTVDDLQCFVLVCEPGAKLREYSGMDVIVGDHTPPPGGPKIHYELEHLLVGCNAQVPDLRADGL